MNNSLSNLDIFTTRAMAIIGVTIIIIGFLAYLKNGYGFNRLPARYSLLFVSLLTISDYLLITGYSVALVLGITLVLLAIFIRQLRPLILVVSIAGVCIYFSPLLFQIVAVAQSIK
jgi:hypothetical protein